ncbi:MAG: hypothetical protein IPH78_02725, partial [Bacteroidetes bacterium]|nr:hypothetical protein [Bacteroidota bacterium]
MITGLVKLILLETRNGIEDLDAQIEMLYSLQQNYRWWGNMSGRNSYSNINGDKTQNILDTSTNLSAPNNRGDYWVVKINATGDKEWDKSFGGNRYDLLYTLKQTKDGGYIFGGVSNSDINADKSQSP